MSTTYKPTGKELLSLVGNPEAYAVQHEDGSWHPVREPLTGSVLRKHRAGDITVGTYIVNPPDQARTLVFDIDAKDQAEQDLQLNTLCQLLAKVVDEYGVEESGRKGYHVWVRAEDYMDAGVLARLGRGIREEAGFPAMEVFPKQAEARDLGNLVKLPGGFHAVTGKPNDFVGPFPGTNSIDALTALAEKYPELRMRKAGGAAASIEYPCVASIQEGVPEGGRNIHLFHLATMLRKWSLNDENVEHIVRRANGLSPDGPLDDVELDALLDSSRHSGPICSQLDESVNCGDQCIMAKHSGLYTRAGNLRWAPVGQGVVLEVSDRTEDGTTIELTHPDAIQVRAALAEAPRRKGGKRADA